MCKSTCEALDRKPCLPPCFALLLPSPTATPSRPAAASRGEYQQVKIRLAAIDAPEKRQPYGQQARQALAGLCFQQQAQITPRSTDRYKRTVADVRCQGQDAGAWMVRHGWAMVYRQYAQQHGHLYALEETAIHERLGQWQALNHGQEPVPPWQWRQRNHSN